MALKLFILIAAILISSVALSMSATLDDVGNQPGSWCAIANPIYVQADDYIYLQSTDHGIQLLDWIETHNQKVIDLCGDLPRTLNK